MCGRYTVSIDEEGLRDIVQQAQERTSFADVKAGEIFPTNAAPILAPVGNQWEARAMVWGFPKWDNKGVIINSRSETALEKPMFRSSLLERRCVVPSAGFFEWHDTGKSKKDKYLVRLPDAPVLYMAGCFNLYSQPDGTMVPRFVILTTAASETMAAIHDRMPVILRPEERGTWLHDADATAEILHRRGAAVVMERVG